MFGYKGGKTPSSHAIDHKSLNANSLIKNYNKPHGIYSKYKLGSENDTHDITCQTI